MTLFRFVLLITAALLVDIDTASAYTNDKLSDTVTASNSHVSETPYAASICKRSLRLGTVDEDSSNSEERALLNEIMHAANHAENVIITGFKESSILNWLDKISQKLQYRYWLWKKTKPEAAKKQLGLHHVSNIESHPNYQKWLRYKEAYNKKNNILE
ncbi:hypothetical protein F442_18559 [Phytophthora nicotianae P10297]|uniref:RxLR effector protein n=1 Tax=Phytophthora nicotianae P10297 TaxID=1317064 RepID=W2YCX9_PHYNI|nr:hypothetical protein F442_18559 [Phytophthora nicotianae P10297]